jgi:hypothetical protein
VAHESDAGTDQEGAYQGHSNGQGEQQAALTLPPTLLFTELDNGALVVQGRPDGPRVWLSPADAVPLKRELAAALGRTKLTAIGDDQGEAQ